MKLRLALTLTAALILAEDARAQISAVPPGPPAGVCAIRLISFGPSPVTGSTPGCLRFDGAAGDRVRFHVEPTAAGGPLPSVSLTRPDGTQSCSGTGPTCMIAVSGRHQVAVSGSGPYALSLQRLSNPVGCTTLLTGNGATTRTLAAGGAPCFRVDGVPGMRLRVRLVSLSGGLNPVAEVLRPNGVTRCAASPIDDTTCQLDATGLHTILVRDDSAVTGTGDFAISVQRLDAPFNCPTIAFATTPVSRGAAVGDSGCSRFDAAPGDQIRVRVRVDGPNPSLHPRWEVLRPDGTTRCGPTTSDAMTCSIDAAGKHAILVRDAGNGHGGYEVSALRLNAPTGCDSGTFSTRATGKDLAIGETGCHVFTGAAGDRIRVRAVKTYEFMQPVMDVIRPDGTTRCAATHGDCVLDATGPHLLLVRDTSPWGFGEYWWSVQRLSDPVGCTTLTRDAPAVLGSVGVGASPCWRFEANDGELIQLDLDKLYGYFQMAVEILRPNGQTYGTQTTGGTSIDTFWRLHDTGTHTLLVRDGGTGLDTGQYDVAVR